jgi:hypothetical protein
MGMRRKRIEEEEEAARADATCAALTRTSPDLVRPGPAYAVEEARDFHEV